MSDDLIKTTWDDKELIRKLNRSQLGVRPIATAGMRETGQKIAQTMRANLARHHGKGGGRLERSIGAKLESRRGLQAAVIGPGVEDDSVEPAFYMTIEKGRRPGSKMPPEAPMVPWFEAHGIPPQAWFPIRKKIGEKGMAGQPFPYIEPTRPEAEKLLAQLGQQVLSEVAKMIGS